MAFAIGLVYTLNFKKVYSQHGKKEKIMENMEKFIEKATTHGNKYDYEIVNYTNKNVKVNFVKNK